MHLGDTEMCCMTRKNLMVNYAIHSKHDYQIQIQHAHQQLFLVCMPLETHPARKQFQQIIHFVKLRV